MGSFARDHLRFLRVDGKWMPSLIFNDCMQIQMMLDKGSITGFENMENVLTKSMIMRYQSGQSVMGSVAIVLGEVKTILWEDAIGETKKFHLFLHHVLTKSPDSVTKSEQWKKALHEAMKLLDIPQLFPNTEVHQVGPASNQVVDLGPVECVSTPAASPSKTPRETSPADTPTVNESVGDCWDREHLTKPVEAVASDTPHETLLADTETMKESVAGCWDREHVVKPVEAMATVIATTGEVNDSATTPSTCTQGMGRPNTQAEEDYAPSTIDAGSVATQDAALAKRNGGGKIAKVRHATKHVSSSKFEGTSKSLIRGRRKSPRNRSLKEVTFQEEHQTFPVPKNTPAVVDDPSVMSEQEIAEEFKVPSTREVLPILSKLGYKNVKTMYYRPTFSGKDKKTLDEGVHYFSSASDLRRFLCKRGVELTYVAIDDDSKELLQKWVRYCICPALRNESFVPNEARTALSSAHNMLVKLGFQFRNPYYYLPGATPINKTCIALNGFEMDGPDGLWANLCRQGLPESCNFQNLTDSDRLRLELYLADCPKVDTL
jgi:hypothetical protein